MTLNIFTNGTPADAEEVNENFSYNKTPIGVVVAWLKDYTNTPSLPDNWVECNGQTLSDTDSVFDGQTIPNLNGAVDSGLKGRFLRGHTESGLTESSQNLSHTHSLLARSTWEVSAGSRVSTGNTHSASPITSGSDGDTESRPHNYSVVWIMRVK